MAPEENQNLNEVIYTRPQPAPKKKLYEDEIPKEARDDKRK